MGRSIILWIFIAVIASGVAIDCSISLANTISPMGIVIHHSALPNDESLAEIEQLHKSRGFGAFYWYRMHYIGYHYIVFPDGTIRETRPEHLRGAHARGANDMIGICVLGNFDSYTGKATPTPAQMASLELLCRHLMRKYSFTTKQIHRHSDIDSYTVCPGDNFPFQRLLNDLKVR
jgi:N-acetylmuramoyl-L-alanine amidase